MIAASLANAAIGDKLPTRVHHVEQALIDLYAEVSGDRNPLHIDQRFAATTHYGRTIAHGMMTLAFASAALEVWAGLSWSSAGSVDVVFLSPVFPGEHVEIRAEVTGIGDDVVVLRIDCSAAGRAVVAGTARIGVRT